MLRLWDLSRLVRRDPVLNELFDAGNAPTRCSARSRPIRDSPSFARRSSDSSTSGAFGARKSSCSRRRASRRDPAPLVDMLRAYARSKANRRATRSARRRRRESERRGAVSRTARRRARGGARRVVAVDHAAIRYRERARLKQALLYSRCRRIALAMAAELVRRGTIAERDDVFYLTWQELHRADRRRGDVPAALCAGQSRREGSSTRVSRRRHRRIRSRWRRASISTTRSAIHSTRVTRWRRDRATSCPERARAAVASRVARRCSRRDGSVAARARRRARHEADRSRLGTRCFPHLRARDRARRDVVARRDHRARVRTFRASSA